MCLRALGCGLEISDGLFVFLSFVSLMFLRFSKFGDLFVCECFVEASLDGVNERFGV